MATLNSGSVKNFCIHDIKQLRLVRSIVGSCRPLLTCNTSSHSTYRKWYNHPGFYDGAMNGETLAFLTRLHKEKTTHSRYSWYGFQPHESWVPSFVTIWHNSSPLNFINLFFIALATLNQTPFAKHGLLSLPPSWNVLVKGQVSGVLLYIMMVCISDKVTSKERKHVHSLRRQRRSSSLSHFWDNEAAIKALFKRLSCLVRGRRTVQL